jgi:hypothetical protein
VNQPQNNIVKATVAKLLTGEDGKLDFEVGIILNEVIRDLGDCEHYENQRSIRALKA